MNLSERRIIQLGIIIGIVLLFLIAGRSFTVPPVDIQVDIEGSGSPTTPTRVPATYTHHGWSTVFETGGTAF